MSNDEYNNVAWEAESDAEQQRIEDVTSDYIEANKNEGCQYENLYLHTYSLTFVLGY